MIKRLLAITALAAMTAAACTTQSDRRDAEAGGEVVPAVSAAPAPALNDRRIVEIFDAANTADIETGQLAAERGSSKAVRDFGAMLARDHKVVRQQGRDLGKKLGVIPTPQRDDAGDKAHREAMTTLRSRQNAEFDKAFLNHEVRFHQDVIDAVRSTLLPAIQNAELKELVVKSAPAFDAHRIAAENLRRHLRD